MTKEQAEAIDRIKYNDIVKPLYCGDITICNIDDLKTVLSMLEEKDKQIDLMAEIISLIDTDIKVVKEQIKEKYCDFLKSDEDYCWKTDMKCSDCIKQYFKNKVKE